MLHAEPGEVLEVGSVGAQSGGGFGGVNVGSRLFDQIFEVGGACGQGKRWGLHGENSNWKEGNEKSWRQARSSNLGIGDKRQRLGSR